MSLGAIGLMRTQDLIYALALIPHWKSWKDRILPLLSGAVIGFAPQFIAWQALYGTFWKSPYLSNYEGFNLLKPHLLEVLFSYNNGLFFWTPIAALGFVGLLVSKLNNWFKAIVIVAIFIVSTWGTWWQGASYSGRMFVSMLPLFALGLANVFTWLWRMRWRQFQFLIVFVGPLSILNMILIIYFLPIT